MTKKILPSDVREECHARDSGTRGRREYVCACVHMCAGEQTQTPALIGHSKYGPHPKWCT